jgi:outer membrane protein assembly factor BamB
MADSPAAAETFLRVRDHLASGNLDEAVRVLQTLLDTAGDRVVPSQTDPDLFVGVRGQVHRTLLATPALLKRYRELQEPVAGEMLAANAAEEAERTRLLTPSGYEAALGVAQRRLESAQFEAARLTLAQLLTHPDHSRERARQAGALMADVARYLDREEVRAAATALAGEPIGPAPSVAWPPLAKVAGVSPLDPAPVVELRAMLGKPLRSVPVGSEIAGLPLDEGAAGTGSVNDDRLPELARELRIMPTAAGDTLYLNDGATITAWDRISLSRKWQATPAPLPEVPLTDEEQQRIITRRQYPGSGVGLEEPSSVTVQGRTAVATTGDAFAGGRERDPRVHAIDALTGLVRWSADVARLSPDLAGVSVRGPAVIAEGVAIVGARRNMPERRLLSLHLAGLDLLTGRLLWSHMVGSAGSLPWSTRSVHVTDLTLLDRGLVYRADMLGVIGAYEAVTGRPVWVRRMPPQPAQAPDLSAPWQMHGPILHGGAIIVLSPDRQQVVRLDALTGEVLGATRTERLSTPPPQYLLKVGDQLAAVCDDRIVLCPIDDLESDQVRTSEIIPEPGIRGRVIAAGSRLLVPVVTGIRVIDAAAPGEPGESVELDSPGSVLSLESQIVVVDDAFIHSYLQWEVAERVLSQRMSDDPADPAPAVTLTELAYRAGQEGRILGAADAALAAIEGAPGDPARDSARKRLFESLHTMIAASQEPAGALAPADEGPATLRIADPELVGALVDRLGRAAQSLDERVSFLLTLGRLQERMGRPELAVETYQEILDDPQLARATWTGPRLSVRGELEATRRLERLVAQEGPQLYAAQSGRAEEAMAAIFDPRQPAPDARALAALATQYPLAGVAAELWSRAADAVLAAGSPQSVIGALESGLEAAERTPGSTWAPVLAGRLIAEFERRAQFAAAGDVLRRFRQRNPGVAIVIDGQPIDADVLATRLGERLAARHRRARVGEPRSDGIQALLGWMILEPVIADPAAGAPGALVLKSDREVAIWGPGDQQPAEVPDQGAAGEAPGDPSASAPISAGELRPIWRRVIEPDMVDLVRVLDDAVLFFFPSRQNSALELVGLNPAQTRWRADLFTTPIADAAAQHRRLLPQPDAQVADESMRSLSDLIVTMDDRTIVAIERGGRAMAIDATSGEVLWHAQAPLDRVVDADLSSGTLVVGGDQAVLAPGPAAGAGAAVVSWRPEFVVLDARTGAEQQRLPQPQSRGAIRWLRLTGPGTLIAGLETVVLSLDLATAQANWVISDYRLASNRDAWIFDDRLYLLDRERHLWLASVSEGRMRPEPLEAPRSRLGGIREIRAFALDDDTTAFSSYQGVLLYANDGALKGIDAIGGFDAVLPPVPAEDRLVTISSMPENRRPDGELVYSLHLLDTTSAMLLQTVPIILGAPPRTILLLDGRIAITAGGTTVILQAPAPQ